MNPSFASHAPHGVAVFFLAVSPISAQTPYSTANLAIGKQCTASSSQTTDEFGPQKGADGNYGTRWSSGFTDPQWFMVDLGEEKSIGAVILYWEFAFGKTYDIEVGGSPDGPWTKVASMTNGDGRQDILEFVAAKGRYVRYNGIESTEENDYGHSFWEFEVYGEKPDWNYGNLAYGKTIEASSVQDNSAGFSAALAVDGDQHTRWASAASDPQWLRIDLGGLFRVRRVVLFWEESYGKTYEIQAAQSADGPWKKTYSTSAGEGRNEDISIDADSCRFVRYYGTERGRQWGHSLWEFRVYGDTIGSIATPAKQPRNGALKPQPRRSGHHGQTQLFRGSPAKNARYGFDGHYMGSIRGESSGTDRLAHSCGIYLQSLSVRGGRTIIPILSMK